MIDKFKSNLNVITIVFISQALAGIGGLAALRVLTEYLTPEIYGEYKIILSFCGVFTALLIRPFSQYAMRYLHDEDYSEDKSFRPIFIANLVLIAPLFIVIFNVSKINSIKSSFVVLIFLVLSSLIDYEHSIATSSGRQLKAGFINNYKRWVTAFFIILFYSVFAQNISSIFIGYSSTLLILILFLRNKRIAFPKYKVYFRYLQKSRSYVLPLMFMGIFSWCLNDIDRFLLLRFQDSREVGIYSSTYGLISTPFAMASGFVSQLAYSYLFKRSKNSRALSRRVRQILVLNTIIAVVGVFMIYVLRDMILGLGLGQDYRSGGRPLVIWIAAGYGFYIIATSLDLNAYSIKKTSFMLISYVIAAIVNITSNFFLIPSQGALGAAKSTALGFLFYLITLLILTTINKQQ